MFNSKKSIVWGILLLLLAAGLILLAFFPQLSWFADIPAWKWFIGGLLFYLGFDRLLFAGSVAGHFDCLIPFSLLFLVFEKEVARLAGLEPDFVGNWLVFGIGVLLTCAFHLIFSNESLVTTNVHTVDQNGNQRTEHITVNLFGNKKKKRKNVCIHTNENNNNGNEENHGAEAGVGQYNNHLTENTVYFDVSEKTKFQVTNQLGQLNIYFQNTEDGNLSTPICLVLDNNMGHTNIRVPSHWKVENRLVTNMGKTKVHETFASKTRTIRIDGTNNMGEVHISEI